MKSDLGTYRRLAGYVSGKVWYFVVAIVGYLLAAYSEVVFAQTLGAVVDIFNPPAVGGESTGVGDSWNWIPGFITQSGWSYTLVFPALIAAIALLRGCGTIVGEFLLSRVSFHVVHSVRCDLFNQLVVLPSSYFDRNRQGAISNRLTNTASKLRDTVTDVLKISIQDTGKLVVLLATLISINAALTGVFLLIAPIVGFVVRIASRRFRRISERIQSSMGEVTQVGQESVSAYKLIRAFGGEDQERQRFHAASELNRRQHLKMVATKASSTQFIQLIVALALGFLIGVLFIPEVSGGMTTGGLVTYITVAGLLANPIKRLSDLNARIQTGLAAAEEIFEQIDHDAEEDNGSFETETVRGEIEFRNVSFRYAGSDGNVLSDFSLRIAPGEVVGIVGTTGSGKSTLTELLFGFYRPTKGEVLLDDVPIRQYTKRNLRSHLALVSQDVFLFNDSLRANIAYGELKDARSREIDEAVRHAHVDEFLDRLPDGLDSVVGDRGLNLSHGQRQRVAIARALLKSAPVLVLDEATSALDPETELLLQRSLAESEQRRTMIVVAHRLSTIEHADRIVVVEGGRILEVGTHRELLASNGRYHELHVAARTTGSPPKVFAPSSNPDQPRQLDSWVDRQWYGTNSWLRALRPLSHVFGALARRRRHNYRTGRDSAWRADKPVVVVGNISIGGTGKTPLVIWLVKWLRDRGIRVGIVSRGYRGRTKHPLDVQPTTSVDVVGDEAPLLAERTQCPVVVHKDRVAAVKHLLKQHEVDVVVADDGLQHYALNRDVEIVVVDGERQFGNGLLLPAGPLREPRARLTEVDWVVVNGRSLDLEIPTDVMHIEPVRFINLESRREVPAAGFAHQIAGSVVAVSAIGNANRFKHTLAKLGIDAKHRVLEDHRWLKTKDFDLASPSDTVIVTEKDWRKVMTSGIPLTNVWYIEVDAWLDPAVDMKLEEIMSAHGIRFISIREEQVPEAVA